MLGEVAQAGLTDAPCSSAYGVAGQRGDSGVAEGGSKDSDANVSRLQCAFMSADLRIEHVESL